jgi:aminopeptidase N
MLIKDHCNSGVIPIALLGCSAVLALLLFGLRDAGAQAAAQSGDVQILHYAAQIEPNIAAKSLSGRVRIGFKVLQYRASEMQLDAGALQIDAVREGDAVLAFSKPDSVLKISLRKAGALNRTRELSIAYHGIPTHGMNFFAEPPQVYTDFSTSQWMPCLDAPNARASLDLIVVVPTGTQVVGNGRLAAERTLAGGKVTSEWSQPRAMPSYLYGFAAGAFREVSDNNGKPTLRYLVPAKLSEDQTRQVFRDSADMIAFYQDKAGIAYPGATYTQVLAQGSVAQELDGIATMGERYAERVLTDEKKIWLGAHELAHQWWGNSVTNRDWTHFWLNEGIATFMTAAYLEHRFGAAEYLRNIDAAREKYEKIRAAGKDKSLVFANWTNPSAEDRSLVYDKGAYVVHLLRKQLGEEAFWAGLRNYTQRNWEKSVVTADFQTAMETASGRDLTAFFTEWVYLTTQPGR